MLRGVYSQAAPTDPLFIGVKSPGMPPPPGTTAPANTRTVGPVVESYVTFKEVHDWTSKTTNESWRILYWFRDHMGPATPIEMVKTDDVRDFRDLLLKVPKGAMKTAAGQG